MRIATIDIGTNTILMLVADISPGGILSTIRDEHSIPRLGEGVDATHLISQTALKRAVEQLRRYRLIAQDENAEMVVACGTSALRDAKNRDDVIDLMGKKTGIRVEVLSGEQEAELTYLGAVSDYLQGDEPLAVLDIGGGSTELTFGNGKTITHRRSLDVGSVRLTERILKTSPPTLQAIEDSRQEVRRQIAKLPHEFGRLIGVAGTATTLAALDLQIPTFDANRVEGHVLTLNRIGELFRMLSVKTVEELRGMPQIVRGREDVLLGGVLILIETMEHLGAEALTVSAKGLRYGIAQREWEKNLSDYH